MRKTFALIAYTAALMLTPQFALAADASACYSVADADARAYCLARAKREPSQCYNIQNAGSRSLCLSEVRR